MKRLIFAAAALCAAAALTVGAQGPRGRMGPGPMPGPGVGGGAAINDPAEFLLAHTGELSLTDAQVTRLAAIARRSAERRRSLRAQIDSIRPERMAGGARPDSAARARVRQRFEQMRPAVERLRQQSQADRRDAIAVLTPDQQAQAWERIAAAGRAGMGRGFRPGRGIAPGGAGARMRPPGVRPGRLGPRNDDAAGGDRPGPMPRRRPDDGR